MRQFFYGLLILWGVVAFHAPQLWLMFFLLFPKEGPGGWPAVAHNALLILGWGGVHSFLARDFAKKAIGAVVGEDLVKLVFVTVAGITQCILLYFWQPLSGELWHAQGLGYWFLTGLFFFSMGAVFISSLLLDYMEALGVRAILRRMRNEPSKSMPLSLRGPYAYCRHPVYLFTLFFLWVGPVMTATKLEFSILATLYIIIGTFLEDRDTARHLGSDYRSYQRNVPLLIPRLTPWKPGKP